MWSPFKDLQKYYTTGRVTTHLYSVWELLRVVLQSIHLIRPLMQYFKSEMVKMCSVGGLSGGGLEER
jgi:hypothetical protein